MSGDSPDILIGQSKLPERDNVAIACFDVVFDNIAFEIALK